MTELTDDRLRAMYAPIASRRPASRNGCPAPEAILALVERDGSESVRMATLDHVMSCGPCKQDFDLLRAVSTAALGDDLNARRLKNAAVSARRGARWMQWGGGLLAASVAIAISVQVLHAPRQADVTRGDVAPSVTSTENRIALVSPESVPVDPTKGMTLVWHSAPGAIQYIVEVLDSEGHVVLTTSTNDTAVTFPDAAQKMTPGTAYQWWVRATTVSDTDRKSFVRELRIK